jgi:autotransporter-associated beta strand protein
LLTVGDAPAHPSFGGLVDSAIYRCNVHVPHNDAARIQRAQNPAVSKSCPIQSTESRAHVARQFMNAIRKQTLLSAFVAISTCLLAHASTVIVSDNYNVTGSGSGFALNTGINRGINPPTTRLTGSTAANLRYINTGTKVATAYTITSSKAQVDAVANPGRFVLSADGLTSFDYSAALGIAAATSANPVVYDINISIKNASSDNQRCSFALGTIESDANSWDFGFQIYRTNSTMTKYFIGKRIDTDASGLAADLNSSIILMGANTFGTEITILMRVTDAGAETTTFNSRVQLSLDNGSTWFYDTATDSDLPNGWRLNASGRHIMFDQAPGAGPVTFDNFSLTWKSGPRTWTGAGANGNWSTAANWGGAVPGNGDRLTFTGSTRTVNTNDLTALTTPSLTFNAGGFTIYGNALTVSTAVTNASGNNTINAAVTSGGALRLQSDGETLALAGSVANGGQTLTADGAGNTTISGIISGTGALTKNGAGTLQLSGGNTYSGNTTINSGAVTIGSSGSIASSPTINIATGATLNTSSSFTIASSQTLARNATSGAASITGPITFASGAGLSLPADGTGDTVSSINVTGNLTLNNNTITVNVSGGALDAGSYALLTYSGTRNGTFNATPVITGSGLKANLRALIFINANTVWLKVIPIETDSVFRVMTYNIHSGADPVTGNIDTTRVSNFINTNHINLISLNEVARNMPRSNGRDIIAEISQKTGLPFVFSNNMQGLPAGQEFGNAILSSFPILSRDHRLLPNINGNEQRGWLKATVDVNGKYINFESTHLDFHQDSTERLMCVTNINAWLADEVVPTMICGDFNDTPNTPFYNLMDNEWNDIWLTAGDGSLGRTVPSPGYPNNLNARIDYIWKAAGVSVKPTNAYVGYTIEASDHYPVITDFILTSTTDHSTGFYFPFNEGTGTTTTDAKGGLQSDGTTTPPWNTNSPAGQPGDYSLHFNGSTMITIADPKQIIGPNPFNEDYTLQAWVKLPLNYAPSERAIMFQYTRNPGFSFSINTNRTLHTTTFKIKDMSSTATVPNDGAWHHVAVVHNDGVNMQFYIDGSLAATVAYTNGAGYRVSSEITIGAASEGANWFTGYLDRIRFENRALTPSELDASAGSIKPALVRQPVANSTFQILNAQTQPDGKVTITWSSIGGKRYRIQHADCAVGPFTDLVRDTALETDPAPAGEPSTQTFTEQAPTDSVRFYRIQLVE